MAKVRDLYMHRKQSLAFYMMPRDLRAVCARRWGKTQLLGGRVNQCAYNLPRGIAAFVGTSKKQMFTRTIPALISSLETFGLVEGVNIGWGRPPKDVPDALLKLKTFDNALWFGNGFIINLISLAIIGSANGLTLSSLIVDEAKFIKKSKLDSEVIPALSGNIDTIGDWRFTDENPLYRSTSYVSDAALTKRDDWLSDEEGVLDQRIEDGEFAGHTYREVQNELEKYASDIMYYNDLLRNAAKTHHRPMEVSPEEKTRIQALAVAVQERRGQFKVVPPTWKMLDKKVVECLLSYHLIEQKDAEKLFNYEYLLTTEQLYRLAQIKNNKRYKDYIRKLQCNAFVFIRGNSIDNIDLLGESYIRRMKASLPPLVFEISVLNKKFRKSNQGFYANLDIDNIHGYIADDCPAIEKNIKVREVSGAMNGDTTTKKSIRRDYEAPDFKKLGDMDDCSLDGDVIDDLPLHVSFDYGSLINWAVTAQIYRRDGKESLNTLSSLFVKNGELLRALIKKWHHYYRPHQAHNRDVFLYFDNTSKFKNYAVEGQISPKDAIIEDLRKYGWNVYPVNMGVAMAHEQKYYLINEALSGLQPLFPRFNRENNESLLIAMENAGLTISGKGFHKDKSGEKLSTNAQTPEGQENVVPEELRTDGTDAWDSLFIGTLLYRGSCGYVPI